MSDQMIKLDFLHEPKYDHPSMPDVWRIYAQLEIRLKIGKIQEPLDVPQALVDTGSPYTILAAKDWKQKLLQLPDTVDKIMVPVGGTEVECYVAPASLWVWDAAQSSPELEGRIFLGNGELTILGMDFLRTARFTCDALNEPSTAFLEFKSFVASSDESNWYDY
ncbi:MAG TPA: hypothetical protein PK156_18865 [Polyangium sp.]|nr:hypothetical protein [Polyangium sp.]